MGKILTDRFRYVMVPFLISFLVLMMGCRTAGTVLDDDARISDQPTVDIPATSADDLVVIDCLLPGQVRMLGRMSFLTPRRPARVTAMECRIRGGEYVAYDRADLKTSLAVWLPQAESGDTMAQTYVGEIYLRGMGASGPQYDQAAKWFEKAVENGSERARISLGYLYEKGLGVPADPAKALNLYRNAVGGGSRFHLEQDDLTVSERSELTRLRREVEIFREKLEVAQRDLTRTKADYTWQIDQIQVEREGLSRARADLERLQKEMPREDPEVREKLITLQKALSQREAILDQQRKTSEVLKQEIHRLETQSGEYQKQLARYKGVASEESQDILALRQEVERRREEALKLKTVLERKESENSRLQRDYNWLQDQIGAEREGLSKARAEMEKQVQVDSVEAQAEKQMMKIALAERQAHLDNLESEAEGLRVEVARLKTDASRHREQLAAYQEKIANMPEPTIEIIKPKILATRGKWVAENNSGRERIELVGKVSAPAGLYNLSVNDKPTQPDEGGLFKVGIPISVSSETQIHIIAVDKQGKRTDLEFLVPQSDLSQAGADHFDPELFGRYFALIIGNNDYKSLPNLDTAVSDAQDVAKLLKEQYGFTTEVMIDASRFDIYNALDAYRKKLTEKDNFLIYYAGHGELDKKNQRGYWLPVDAVPDSHINSIPNYTITDILNNMTVKQAIIIADTCYSGILTRSVVSAAPSGMSSEKRHEWLKEIARERSRTVLSSGGLKPVLDVGSGGHSLFANALLDVLSGNREILEASAVYRKVRSEVQIGAQRLGFEQVPQYAANLQAGHEGGDFLFVPVN